AGAGAEAGLPIARARPGSGIQEGSFFLPGAARFPAGLRGLPPRPPPRLLGGLFIAAMVHRGRRRPVLAEAITITAMATPRPMPAASLGHGTPMNALERNRYSNAWRAFGALVPRPRAVLVVSAHWFVNTTAVTA